MIDRRTRHTIYRYVINWLYPNICPRCGRIIDYNDDFCEGCKAEITRYGGSFVIAGADAFFAYCVYDDKISGTVLRYKHTPDGNSYYAFAKCLYELISADTRAPLIDVITGVPMTKRALKERGYDQIALMAKELSVMTGLPYLRIIEKTVETREQKGLLGSERAENVKGVFRVCNRDAAAGKTVLLIDDVCTTGSTLSEAARALKEGGAERVYAAAFAKT